MVWAQGPPPPQQVLVVSLDGGVGGRVIWRTLPRRERRYSGQPNAAHNLQCGGEHGGPPLRILGGGMEGGRQQ